MAGFNPQKSSVTSEELNEPIRRPNFKKRGPTESGLVMQPLPSQIGVTKGQNPFKTVSREDGFSEGDGGDLAHMTGESLSGMDKHLAGMALDGDEDTFNQVIDII